MIGLYISHPEVNINPAIPTPNWGLSEIGRRRAEIFAARDLVPKSSPIYASKETKALELAQILAATGSHSIFKLADLGENDRSATGYLSPSAFDEHVTQLFAHPDQSVNGWETANDAQKRIVGAVANIHHALDHKTKSDELLVFTGHGCVGTLLKCLIAGRAIAQSEDQRQIAHPGGGNIFLFDLARKHLLCDWTPMEDWAGF